MRRRRTLRDRAYTLVVETYDEIRRALNYVRWAEDDADEIAPSLYAGRAHRRAPKEDPETDNSTESANTTSTTASTTTSTAAATANKPGSNPFLDQ